MCTLKVQSIYCKIYRGGNNYLRRILASTGTSQLTSDLQCRSSPGWWAVNTHKLPRTQNFPEFDVMSERQFVLTVWVITGNCTTNQTAVLKHCISLGGGWGLECVTSVRYTVINNASVSVAVWIVVRPPDWLVDKDLPTVWHCTNLCLTPPTLPTYTCVPDFLHIT